MMPVDFLIFAGIGSAEEAFHKTSSKPWRSIGPSKIANSLRNNGYTVQVINFATILTKDQLYKISRPFVGPRTLLGVSTTFLYGEYSSSNAYEDLQTVVKQLKQEVGSKVILGGPSAHAYQNYFDADFIVKGYAENKILDLFDQIFNHGVRRKTRSDWDIKTCNHRWHESDRLQPGESIPLEIGRGCIFTCKYCKFDMLGKKRGEYVRDMSMIKDEIVENFEKYKITNYMMMDDTFNDDVHKLEDWCKMVDSLPFKIQYTAYCRADLLWRYQDISRELYRTGLIGSTLGIESMNPHAAKVVGKGWSGKHAKDFIPYYIHDICKGRTLTQINFIIGLPGDTLDDVWSWIHWAKENNVPTVHAQPLVIRPPRLFPDDPVFSEFDKDAESKYGYSIPNDKRPYVWKNDIMTWFDARKEYRKIYDYISNNFCDLSWHGFSSLSLGYSIDEIQSTPLIKFYEDPKYTSRSQSWLDSYVESFND